MKTWPIHRLCHLFLGDCSFVRGAMTHLNASRSSEDYLLFFRLIYLPPLIENYTHKRPLAGLVRRPCKKPANQSAPTA